MDLLGSPDDEPDSSADLESVLSTPPSRLPVERILLLIGAGLLCLLLLMMIRMSGCGRGLPGQYYLRTERERSAVVGEDVTYRGVDVGEVIALDLKDDGLVVVVRLDRRYANLPRTDARWRSGAGGTIVLEDAGRGERASSGHTFELGSGSGGASGGAGHGPTLTFWLVLAALVLLLLRLVLKSFRRLIFFG